MATLTAHQTAANQTICTFDNCNQTTLRVSDRCAKHHKLLTTAATGICLIDDCDNHSSVAGFCRNHHVRVSNKGNTCAMENCETGSRSSTYCPLHYRQHLNGFKDCGAPNCTNKATHNSLCGTHHKHGTDYIIGESGGVNPLESAWVYHVTNLDGTIGKIGISQNITDRLRAHKNQGLPVVKELFKLPTWILARRCEKAAQRQLAAAGAQPAATAQDMPYGGYTETFKIEDLPVGFHLSDIIQNVTDNQIRLDLPAAA